MQGISLLDSWRSEINRNTAWASILQIGGQSVSQVNYQVNQDVPIFNYVYAWMIENVGGLANDIKCSLPQQFWSRICFSLKNGTLSLGMAESILSQMRDCFFQMNTFF